MKKENFGFNIKIKFKKTSIFYRSKTKINILHNITEIHYNFESIIQNQIAFESDIHETGHLYLVDEIEEFEAKLATKKEVSF